MLFCRRNGRRISTLRRYVMGGRFANLWFMNSVICMYILAMPRQKEGAKSENRTNLFFFSEMWKLRESWVDSRCGIWEREEHEGKWWRREYELYFSSLLMGLEIQCVSIPLVEKLVMVVESNGRKDGLWWKGKRDKRMFVERYF